MHRNDWLLLTAIVGVSSTYTSCQESNQHHHQYTSSAKREQHECQIKKKLKSFNSFCTHETLTVI